MAKIQLLTDKQVLHLFDSISVILSKELQNTHDKIYKVEVTDKLKGELKTNKKVIELTKEYDKELDEFKTIAKSVSEIRKISKDITVEISRKHFWRFENSVNEYSDDSKKFENEKKESLKNSTESIAKQALTKKANINDLWGREISLCKDIKAKLALTTITSYDEVVEIITDSIDINNYFKPL